MLVFQDSGDNFGLSPIVPGGVVSGKLSPTLLIRAIPLPAWIRALDLRKYRQKWDY